MAKMVVKKVGKLKNVEELFEIELEEGESAVIEGIGDVKILIERKKEVTPEP